MQRLSLTVVYYFYRKNLLTGSVEENVTQNQLEKICVSHRQLIFFDSRENLLRIPLLQTV